MNTLVLLLDNDCGCYRMLRVADGALTAIFPVHPSGSVEDRLVSFSPGQNWALFESATLLTLDYALLDLRGGTLSPLSSAIGFPIQIDWCSE